MPGVLSNFLETVVTLLRFDRLADLFAWFDIALLWFVIYQLLMLIRRTRAVQTVYGLLGLVLLWFATDPQGPFPLQAVHWVLGQLLVYGGFAVIVIFQTPIRQALAHFGQIVSQRVRQAESSGLPLEEVALAAATMASRRVGALIVFERIQGLRNYTETGLQLDSRVTYDLLMNIFSPRTPLHDGAVIIGGGRIIAASCFLPLTTAPTISRAFGTRHRAAIGITEETDAVAVVVSEERGIISLVNEGKIEQDLDAQALRQSLEELMAVEKGGSSPFRRWSLQRPRKARKA